ncbi:MAG TPA: MurR/RpiR family transcriptional regulator, partial [Alphaproteobacteria bacterium]|nr:MurR/RpiR family transcriptional regulator [Alphaproteobacteria bacterium]
MKPSLESASDEGAGGGLARFRAALADNLEQTFAHIPPGEFDAVVDLVTDTRRALYLIGGRFTDPVARYMAAHLRIVRPGVVHMAGQVENLRDQILDMRRGDTLVVFDVRRYQEDIVALARGAAGRGVKVVLITDQWLSPISRVAVHIMSAHISVPSNWDSNASVMALVEALLAAATERLGASAEARIAEIERIRKSK